MSNFILEDTTLRDGEQAPGIAFSRQTKLKIFNQLVETGVKWLEVGIPAMGGEELATIEEILERKSEANLVGWNRGVEADVIQSLDLGFDFIHIGLPTSNIHLRDSVKKDRAWLLSTASDLIKLAKDRGAFVSISAEDVGRSEIEFVEEYAAHVKEAGANRLRLSDTVGILTPERYSDIIKRVKAAADIALQCHTHNDFGLATANTLAGLSSGATYFHVTVNAVGERAGMPDMAQCVLALKELYDVDVGINTTKLTELSALVAQATRAPIPPWQPVIGSNVFAHESGIHTNGTIRNTKTFEPFEPELVGGKRKIVIGKHSGRASIAGLLTTQGIDVDEQALGHSLAMVRTKSMQSERALTDEEVVKIYSQAMVGSGGLNVSSN